MSYTIEIKTLPAQTVVTMRADTTPAALAEAFGELLPAVHAETAEPARSYEMPATRVVSLMHVGSYEGLGEAHAAL